MKKRYRSLQSFFLWQQQEHPVNWVEVFGYEAPLEAEIGFGNGEFLVRRASAHPERTFVGMELAWSAIRRALRQIEAAGLKNVRILLADSRVAFDRLFPPQFLDRIYSLFPMPWPKERHQKHRLFSHRFLQLLNNRLKPEGKIQIVTDYEPYFEWVLHQIPGTGFQADSKLTVPLFNTKYERKWEEKGQDTFFEINLVKKEHLEIPLKEEVTLKTYCVNHFDPENFNPSPERGDIVVQFQEFIYDPQRRKGMVRVMVIEDALTQHFWIEIGCGEGRWFIKVARGCEFVSTLGVQRALDLVYEATGNT